MTIFIAPLDENNKRLVHKLGCANRPPIHDCREAVEGPTKEKSLSNAKSQVPHDAEYVELCSKCWP